jgi:hypothetical protein
MLLTDRGFQVRGGFCLSKELLERIDVMLLRNMSIWVKSVCSKMRRGRLVHRTLLLDKVLYPTLKYIKNKGKPLEKQTCVYFSSFCALKDYEPLCNRFVHEIAKWHATFQTEIISTSFACDNSLTISTIITSIFDP